MGSILFTSISTATLLDASKENGRVRRSFFDGHMDTVPVTNEKEWIHPPFAAEIHDGKIYGRGTTDMKGAIAAYTTAAIAFAKDTNKDFAGEIYVDGVVHEECFEGVGSRSISAYVKPDIVVIGEASQVQPESRPARTCRNRCGNLRQTLPQRQP